ncbi:MAG: FAD-dependent oxidoreductase, partial [Solobacterium sp.]|nr:FAD-dependent oxidoreductase [Solobacterium sp.]
PEIENIPGFTSISGAEFADKMVDQALTQGAEIEFGEVISLEDHGDYKVAVTDTGDRYEAKAVILATGAAHRHLGLPEEEKFIGNGESFCAVCDGAFYKDRTVALVGGGNSALVEAVMLAGLVNKLYILQDMPFLTGEAKMQERLRAKDNVEILCNVKVTGLIGDEELTGVRIEQDGEPKEIMVDGLFVAIGTVPQNNAFRDLLDLDERGYVVAKDSVLTKTRGIFVAGDCRTKRVRQVTTAAADGAEAAIAAVNFIEGRA